MQTGSKTGGLSMHGGAEQQGKPPKGAAAIRAALDAVQQASGPLPVGPHAAGLRSDEQLAIASFYDREIAERFLERLVAAGIMTGSLRRGFRQDQVFVDCGDRQRAAELLAIHLEQTPDRVMSRYRRTADMALLGAVLGAIGVASESVSSRTLLTFRGAGVAFGFTLYGGLIGLFLGQLDAQARRAGRLQFSLRDMLLAMTLLSLLILSWQTLASLLR